MLPVWFKLSVEGSSASPQLDPEPEPADTVLSKDVKIWDPSNLTVSLACTVPPAMGEHFLGSLCCLRSPEG